MPILVLMADLPYIKKIFPNGMKYIFVPQSQSLATTVLILVSTGSDYEGKEINGVSHFLEHLCFKGTTTVSYTHLTLPTNREV